MNEVVNEFSSFFVNIGHNLANRIRKHDKLEQKNDWKGESRVVKSIFLADITENEIAAILNKTKNKTSTDCDGLDMVVVKKDIRLYNYSSLLYFQSFIPYWRIS